MQIRMKTHLAGPLKSYDAGQELTMPDVAAQRLIDAGFAEEIKSELKVVEKADKRAKVETR